MAKLSKMQEQKLLEKMKGEGEKEFCCKKLVACLFLCFQP